MYVRILKVGEIMEFLYCDGILYQYCPNVYKKLYYIFYAVQCCKSFQLMVRITEEIYKSHRKNSKELKKGERS